MEGLTLMFLQTTMSNRTRWYLCEMYPNANKWTCRETIQELALDSRYGRFHSGHLTKAIPIESWVPKFLDTWIVRNSLRPKVTFSNEYP